MVLRLTVIAAIMAAVFGALSLGATDVPTVRDLRYFRIGTGSTAGTYFPIGEALASVISLPPGAPACKDKGRCGVPGLIGLAQATDGSIANIIDVAAGRRESGLAQGDLVYWSTRGAHAFARSGPLKNIRVIANLYAESVHVVVRKDTGIGSIAGLRGKRLSVDRRDSGTYSDAIRVLAAYGLREVDFIPTYEDQSRAADLLLAGELDGFFFVGGYPSQGIADLAARGAIDILPIDGKAAKSLTDAYPFFVSDKIPEGAYNGVKAVPTISVGAAWIVNAGLDEKLVYQITRALWHPSNRRILNRAHAKGREITLDTAIVGLAAPLHPGAARYYREVSLID